MHSSTNLYELYIVLVAHGQKRVRKLGSRTGIPDPQAKTIPVSLVASGNPAKDDLAVTLITQIGALKMIIRSQASSGHISQCYHEMLKYHWTSAHVHCISPLSFEVTDYD